METLSQDGSFEEMLEPLAAEIQTIARRLRELIDAVHPTAVEVVWAKQGIAGYGLGPKKMSEQYAYVAPQTKHVNLGFYYGAALPDPAGVLEGTGKAMRHVKVRSRAETDNEALRQLLQAALAERRTALKRE
jgi:hypothetical protein